MAVGVRKRSAQFLALQLAWLCNCSAASQRPSQTSTCSPSTPHIVSSPASSVSPDGLLLGSCGGYSEPAGAVFLAIQGPQWCPM